MSMGFDNRWPDFSQDPRNMRLGLALDGMNPFSDQSTKWSTWPVFLINYNLPPWLATKSFFLDVVIDYTKKEKCDFRYN